MTLCVAWVIKFKNTEELVIATDSRLRGGYSWDCGPKIMLLPRTDCAICFEGGTADAYPIMLQLQSAVRNFPKSISRFQDLTNFADHAVKIMNGMRLHIGDLPRGQTLPEMPQVSFLLGGYSWQQKNFHIWRIWFDNHANVFTKTRTSTWAGQAGADKRVSFSGDYVEEAKERLVEVLRKAGKIDQGGFDMEPFEVLRDMLRSSSHPLIGGPPQIVKVYRHLNAVPIAVKWRIDDIETTTLLGRPLLRIERTSHGTLDPDNLKISKGDYH